MTAMPSAYRAVVPVAQMQPISTKRLFRAADQTGNSPLDAFLLNARRINQFFIHYQSNWAPEVGVLSFQGYMSAVESYFRAIIDVAPNFYPA
jgi:hypothetical protein